MLIDQKKLSLTINIASIVFGALIMVLAIFAYEAFITFICVVIGISIVLMNIYPLAMYISLMQRDKRYIPDFIITILFILLGFYFVFDHGFALTIIAGVCLILLPIVRICISVDKKRQLKRELPSFIVGALILFNLADFVFRYALIVFGAVLIIIGIVNIILSNRVVKKKEDNSNIIDAEIREL